MTRPRSALLSVSDTPYYHSDSRRLELECLDTRQHPRCLRGLPGLPEVVRGLLGHPYFGGAAVIAPQPALDAQGHGRADGRTAVEHLRQGGSVDAQLFGRLTETCSPSAGRTSSRSVTPG